MNSYFQRILVLIGECTVLWIGDDKYGQSIYVNPDTFFIMPCYQLSCNTLTPSWSRVFCYHIDENSQPLILSGMWEQ